MPQNVPCLLPPPKPALCAKPKTQPRKLKSDESEQGTSFQDALGKVKKPKAARAQETGETKKADAPAKLAKAQKTTAGKAQKTQTAQPRKVASDHDEAPGQQDSASENGRERQLPQDGSSPAEQSPQKNKADPKSVSAKPHDPQPRPAAVVSINPQPKQAAAPAQPKAEEATKPTDLPAGSKQRKESGVARTAQSKAQANANRQVAKELEAPNDRAARQATTDSEPSSESSTAQQADMDGSQPGANHSKTLAVQPRQVNSNDASSQVAQNPSTTAANATGSQAIATSDDDSSAAGVASIDPVTAAPRETPPSNLLSSDGAASAAQAPSHVSSDPAKKAFVEALAPRPPEAQFVEANHPKIITAIHGQLLPNGGSMHIRLDPPELGALHVRVEMRDGVMTAAFETSNDQATKLLSHSLGDLKTALEAQGVSVEKLHVQQSPREQSSSGDNSRGDRDAHQEQAARQEQQRKEMLRRMWRRLSNGQDPLDLVA